MSGFARCKNLSNLASNRSASSGFLLIVFAAGIAILAASSNAKAQDEPFDPNAAPPPIKRMSADEEKRLESAESPNDRVKLAVDLMEARLRNAESNAASAEYKEMYRDLGAFQALMDDTIDYLYKALADRKKVFDSFKRFEIKLRSFAPRLALIRREIPLEYDPYVRDLLKYLRDARSKAVDPLFGDPPAPRTKSASGSGSDTLNNRPLR